MTKRRTTQDRELDTLTVGEPVWYLSGVCLYETKIDSIAADFVYSTHTAPLGYRVRLPYHQEPEFVVRDQLFRRPAEVAELHAEIESSIQSLEYLKEEIAAVTA